MLYYPEIWSGAVQLKSNYHRETPLGRYPLMASAKPAEKRKEKPSALRSVIAGASAGAVEIGKCTFGAKSGDGLFEGAG